MVNDPCFTIHMDETLDVLINMEGEITFQNPETHEPYLDFHLDIEDLEMILLFYKKIRSQ